MGHQPFLIGLVAAACAHAATSKILSSGRYAATVDMRVAGCEMSTCAARVALSKLDLELRPDGTAALAWTRHGCNLVLGGGHGPMEMPNDPDPDWLCGPDGPSSPGASRDLVDLAGTGTFAGRWTSDGALQLGAGKLRCAHDTRATLACHVDGAWDEGRDFLGAEMNDEKLFLDASPTLRVHVSQRGLGARYETTFSRDP